MDIGNPNEMQQANQSIMKQANLGCLKLENHGVPRTTYHVIHDMLALSLAETLCFQCSSNLVMD
eukprot:6492726-Amphidinium_carterae.8